MAEELSFSLHSGDCSIQKPAPGHRNVHHQVGVRRHSARPPMGPEFREGNTLGDEHKHCFRAKFFRQYRLFFRYHTRSKGDCVCMVNDEDTRRACEGCDDAVFRKMFESGKPPDDRNQ
jgi:hypothetical protein